MYKDAKFKIRSLKDIKEDLLWAKNNYRDIDRIFLADGDALIMPFEELLEVLKYIEVLFPNLDRVSLYASAKSILSKTKEQLEELRKSIQIVEYKNKRQFHLVDRWLFELVRMFYDAGYLRGVSEETCDFLLCKIERIQSLLKKASE